MLDGPIGLARRLIDRVFPRGAITLSILSLGYFGMGLFRNRVFANTFGRGRARCLQRGLRIPEIALDILVASGLSAPLCRSSSAFWKAPTADAARRRSGGRS
jgi:hypothetical protein